MHAEMIVMVVTNPEWDCSERFCVFVDEDVTVNAALGKLFIKTQECGIDANSFGVVDVFQWKTYFPNVARTPLKKNQVIRAEELMHMHMRELCVTKELECHCEDVRGWKLGFLPEPDWDHLWGVYKSAESEIKEWPLGHHRNMFMEFADALGYLKKHGTDKVVVVDDGQDIYALQWVGEKAGKMDVAENRFYSNKRFFLELTCASFCMGTQKTFCLKRGRIC
jgi:hypothetical protein